MKWSDSSPDKEGTGMFIVGEIGEPSMPNSVHTKPIYFVYTTIGLTLLALGIFFYLYSAAIMSFFSLREDFWNFGFASLTLGLASIWLSRHFRTNLGYTSIINTYNGYKINPLFGNSSKIDKTKIFALSIQHFDRYFGLFKDLPYVVISTYDKTYKIPLYKYNNQEEVINYFSEISHLLQDDYYSIFQKSEINFPTIFQRVWRQGTGKIGIFISLIYLFFAAWGGFSAILYPSNVLYQQAFFLKNPELSFSFLDGYDTRTIIYLPPSFTFFLGTDFFGRDIFSRLIHGTTHAFGVAFMSASITISLVMLMGFLSALGPTWLDELISRLSDTLLTFPPILLIIIVGTYIGAIITEPDLYYYYMFFYLAFLLWPQGVKLLKNEIVELMKQEFMIVSRRAGSSQWRLIKKHIIPKISPTIVLMFVYMVTEVIIAMTMIGLIGLGSTGLNWGSDIYRAIIFVDPLWDVALIDRWWTLVYPCIWVAGLIIGLTLLSDSIRDQYQISVNRMVRRTEDI